MNHLAEDQLHKLIRNEISGADQKACFSHIDLCPECKTRYLHQLFPSIITEEPLSANEKETLFAGIEKNRERSSATLEFPETRGKILVFKKRFYLPAAAGLALAASLLLVVVPQQNQHTPQTPSVSQSIVATPAIKPLPQNSICATTAGIEINGKIQDAGTILADSISTIRTAANQQRSLQFGADITLTLLENSSCTVEQWNGRILRCALRGELEGTMRHGQGRDWFVAVNGGTYHVIGTIFHIWSNAEGSSILVRKGAVAYIPDNPALRIDTITAGKFAVFHKAAAITAAAKPAVDTTALAQSAQAETADIAPASSMRDTVSDTARTILDARRAIVQRSAHTALTILKPLLNSRYRSEALYYTAAAYEKQSLFDSAFNTFTIVVHEWNQTQSSKELYNEALISAARIAFDNLNKPAEGAALYQTYLNTTAILPSRPKNEAFQRVLVYMLKKGDHARQLEWLKQWIERSPEIDYPVYLYATTLRERGDNQLAASYYEMYILKYPGGSWSEESYYWAALCHKRLGHGREYAKKAEDYKTRFPQGKWVGDF